MLLARVVLMQIEYWCRNPVSLSANIFTYHSLHTSCERSASVAWSLRQGASACSACGRSGEPLSSTSMEFVAPALELWRFVQDLHAYIRYVVGYRIVSSSSYKFFFGQSRFIFRRATFGFTYRLMGNFDYSLHCGELWHKLQLK